MIVKFVIKSKEKSLVNSELGGILWGVFHLICTELNRYTNNIVDTTLWTKILLDLGYIGVVDHGFGIIHKNEKCKALFFGTKYNEL
jgi:hypothetical protein